MRVLSLVYTAHTMSIHCALPNACFASVIAIREISLIEFINCVMWKASRNWKKSSVREISSLGVFLSLSLTPHLTRFRDRGRFYPFKSSLSQRVLYRAYVSGEQIERDRLRDERQETGRGLPAPIVKQLYNYRTAVINYRPFQHLPRRESRAREAGLQARDRANAALIH